MSAHATPNLTARITALTASLLAFGALVDAAISVSTKLETPICRLGLSLPWCTASPGNGDHLAGPETEATRVHAFDFQTPPQEIKPGFRKWTRVAPDVWQQLYPDGTKDFEYRVKRINLNDCDGTVVSSKNDQDFQAYFPDRNCETPQFMFRRVSQGLAWHAYVPIDHME